MFQFFKLEKFWFKITVLSLSPSVQQQSCLVDLWPVHMSPLYHPWENRQIIYDSFPPCFSPISLELDVFVLILKVHWKENIGHPPCHCLVNFGSELRQSSFQLHFVQILASWWKRKQARKGHLVTWLPGHLTVTTWLPGFSKSWKHFSRWRLHCSHYLLSLGRKMPEDKINSRVVKTMPGNKIKIPSKLEVAPHALKMLTGWWMGDGWSGYPLDCYDY